MADALKDSRVNIFSLGGELMRIAINGTDLPVYDWWYKQIESGNKYSCAEIIWIIVLTRQ